MEIIPVEPNDRGIRLDVWMHRRRPALSRNRIQSLIKDGHIRVSGRIRKPHYPLHESDRVEIEIPPPPSDDPVPEDRPLDIRHEDEDIIVVNKPAGLVVHPSPGHITGTLVNALRHRYPEIARLEGGMRPGIVHRLDKDTSGVMVIARSPRAVTHLQNQFKERMTHKEYLAIVRNHVNPESGTVETRVGRSPHNRKKMSAHPDTGRQAVTRYETLERFPDASLLRLVIETGRTHQIRVHMAYLGHPVLGDRTYGKNRRSHVPVPVGRQMLHAERLAFRHPANEKPVEFTVPIPEDMRQLIRALRPG